MCPAYNNIQLLPVMREGFAFSVDLNKMMALLFLSALLCMSYLRAASELLSWSMELLVFACRQVGFKIVNLSVRFNRILFSS